MSYISGSLSEYQDAGGPERKTQGDSAGWVQVAFFAAMVLILIVSVALLGAISYR
jgi:hypothetical protein